MLESTISFDEIMAEVPIGLVIVASGEIVSANAAAERALGYPHGGLTGKPLGELLAEPPALASLGRGETRTLGGTARRADGSTVRVGLAVTAHGDAARRAWSLVVRDPSSARDEATRQLAERERDALLAVTAHQLRSPIQPVLASLRTIDTALHRGLPVPPDVLPRALRQTLRLARLVDAIVADFGASSPRPPRLESLDLRALLQEIVDDVRLAWPERSFRFASASTSVLARSSADAIQQIVGTLLDNAIKYSRQDIVVELEPRRDGGATVRVIDQGIGIPERAKTQVFSRSYRADNAQGTTHGLGLGLYFAHELAERVGASLTVESREGQGSTFILRLPASSPRRGGA